MVEELLCNLFSSIEVFALGADLLDIIDIFLLGIIDIFLLSSIEGFGVDLLGYIKGLFIGLKDF